MSELPRQSARGASYRVEFEPALVDDQGHMRDDWHRLSVIDVNGAILHSTMLHTQDIPQEVAVAVERAEKLRVESYFHGPKAKR